MPSLPLPSLPSPPLLAFRERGRAARGGSSGIGDLFSIDRDRHFWHDSRISRTERVWFLEAELKLRMLPARLSFSVKFACLRNIITAPARARGEAHRRFLAAAPLFFSPLFLRLW